VGNIHFKLHLEGDVDMSIIEDLKALAQAVVNGSESLEILATSVNAGFSAVTAKIQELKEQLASGTTITEADIVEVQGLLLQAQENISDSLAQAQETLDKQEAEVAA
jgi:propanediol dehydratase large subunit